MIKITETRSLVREYYGKTLKTNGDLKTNACCSIETLPDHHKKILSLIDDEILIKFYGCGSPLPLELQGKTVLDLGCGSGRDVYLASYLVGESGKVIGVDMTDEQLAIARAHIAAQTQKFGFAQPNVEFKSGYIEDLAAMNIADHSVDVVISNCVINLSEDKSRVFREIFRVLKPGGELYFADVFADRRVPDEMRSNALLYGECLGGALYLEDFRRMLLGLGINDFRIISTKLIALQDNEMKRLVGPVKFSSITVRAFNLETLEDRCEDYGQVAIYQGTIAESPHSFILDNHHMFIAHQPMLVCGNTAAMIQETRFSPHFKIIGDRKRHFGLFPCGTPISSVDPACLGNGGCC